MEMPATSFCSKLLLAFFLCFFFSINAIAQQTTLDKDDIVSKLKLNWDKNESPILYIHFDKNVYTGNEKVWFTGYLFKSVDLSVYKMLSIALINNDTKHVVLDDKFLMSNGIVLGSTTIPDTVAAGEYSFIAYANRLLNGKPNVLFTQRVTIKSANDPTYTATLNPLDTSVVASHQKVMLLVNFLITEKVPETVPVSYYVGNGTKPLLQGDVKTENGKYIFDIPTNILSTGNNKLHVFVKQPKEVKELIMDLPLPRKPAIVKFYPEGGALVNNILSNVGWEVTDVTGKPLKASAVLFQDKKAIANITTNSYGLNRFTIKPLPGHRYYVKLVGINRKDTLYSLPPPINSAPILNIASAVVNDTLIAKVKSLQPRKLYVVGHDYKQIFFSSPVKMDSVERRVKILLSDIPKGLVQITLVDSLGTPYADRLIFAHYNRRSKLDIVTDSNTYGPRQKVILKVKLNDLRGPDSGLVSIACVQDSRLNQRNRSDIESYFYLQSHMDNLPVKENYLGEQKFDKQFLEDLLLVKGWSKYKWMDMLNPTVTDTTRFEDVVFKGNVTHKKKPIKKVVPLMSFDNVSRPLSTDNQGGFELSYTDLITLPDKVVSYVVKGATEFEYEVNLADPFIALNKKVADSLEIKNVNFIEQPTSQQMAIPGTERSIKIKEVTIKAKPPRRIYANECGDYICRYNIFNCPNHKYESDNVLPVVGRYYLRTGIKTAYLGCGMTENRLALKGIYLPKRFYAENAAERPADEPMFLSTLFWKHLTKVSTSEYIELPFYTGDIPGKFRIIVQGVAGNNVTYGEKVFNVFKPMVQ